MDHNPYQAPKGRSDSKTHWAKWQLERIALIGFPIGWACFPVLWIISVVENGISFAGVRNEVLMVAAITLFLGTLLGIALWIVLYSILWCVSRLCSLVKQFQRK
jgi:hypothetical protein